MQFIFNEDSNLYGYANGEEEFEFPSNIKQMGSIDDDIKIYMEDYVYTYLYQYAKTGSNKEKLAALVGRHMLVDGKQVIVISGAIQGKSTVQEKGVETFTQDTWNYINTQLSIYFRGLTLVGWVHTQPGFGAFLMSRDEIFHREYFKNPWQVLFVIDPLDKIDTFFANNYEKTGLKHTKGYFIYYDKNENMQEYMLNNSLVRPKISEEEEVTFAEEIQEPTFAEEKRKPTPEERMDAAKKIRKVLKSRAEEAEAQTKKRDSLLTGISTILCVVCFIMGISLMNNLDRIKKLETEVVTVKTSYTNIVERINQSDTAAAFAAQQQQTQAPAVAAQQQQTQAPAVAVQEQPKQETPVAAQEQPKQETPVAAQEQPKQETPVAAQEQPKQETPVAAQEQPKQEVPAAAQEQPKQEAQKENEEIPAFYVIEDGDTLGYISEKFYGTGKMVSRIIEENGLEDADKIIIGKKLALPRP